MTHTVTHSNPYAAFVLDLPTISEVIPFIADSPHSGVKYPSDFNFALPFHLLRTGEDTDINVLWRAIPHVGGTLLAAEFPRSYIDPNREIDDIDLSIFAEDWCQPVKPTEKSKVGAGLIWTRIHHKNESVAIYDRLLTAAEVQKRIQQYYIPYHSMLQQQVNYLYSNFGSLWHLNLHSMPDVTFEKSGAGQAGLLSDFVLGNRDHTTCSLEFIHFVADVIQSKGYSVALNHPYKGVALIANIGSPAQNKHSLQVEINRKLYMDEQTRKRNGHFLQLQNDLNEIVTQIAEYVKDKISA